jgi:hypothetical protein
MLLHFSETGDLPTLFLKKPNTSNDLCVFRTHFTREFPKPRASYYWGIFSLVQRRASSLRPGFAHAGDGALRSSGKRVEATSSRARCCLSTSPGALRTKRSEATPPSRRSLDQQANSTIMRNSLNFVNTCLKVLDTHRAGPPVRSSQEICRLEDTRDHLTR